MERSLFEKLVAENAPYIDKIKIMAHKVHADVNQHYGGSLPYSVHLDSVVRFVREYGHHVCARPSDVLPIFFGAYFHDSIEDARLTYNDVKKIALGFMLPDQALMAAEIVYALTNEKGRTRAERADARYYAGICSTPYAPMCKLADRLANVSFSLRNHSHTDNAMKRVYAAELPHFLKSISASARPSDIRLSVPAEMSAALKSICG